MSRTTTLERAELPLTVQLGEVSPDAFVSYYFEHRKRIEARLSETGAIKFRGVVIDSPETFRYITNSISDKFLGYTDGTSPRTRVTGDVYTSTEYDKKLRITMHNELSYSARWPGKLFFCCLYPAESGGETLLVDSRKILRNMDPDIVYEVKKRGITYIRNLHGGAGVGVSWQQAFETDSKKQFEEYCRALHIDLEWRENDNVRLKQVSKGIITHSSTREEVWFNQIDQFHPYQLGKEVYNAMITIYESPEDFPTYVKFGDGKVIEESMIEKILNTTEKFIVAPQWDKNELLLIDNVLISHGRNPYTGERKVLVAMSA